MNNTKYPVWFDGAKIHERLFCHQFLHFHPMRCIGGQLFTVNGPIESEDLVRKQILDLLEGTVTSGLSKKVTALLETLKIFSYADPLPLETDRIHVANGCILLDGSFYEQKEYCRNRLAVSYNPGAQSPEVWLRFLGDLLNPEDILTLQEYLGYCLIPSTKAQKMLVIVGDGGEGKSQIGLIMDRMFGSSMCMSSIRKVETNRFARADLQHRLLMVDDDMDMNALPKTNYLKSIVTAAAKMDLERKGLQSYQEQLYVRFLCFGNGTLSALYDHSGGFYRRQILLTAKERPADRKDDPFLLEKMTAELEGIFLWCLEGLRRLIENDYQFTVSTQAKEAAAEMQQESSNVESFLCSAGYIRLKADSEASSGQLYSVYKLWCEDNATHCMSSNTFIAELKKLSRKYFLEYTNNVYLTGNKRVRGFMGIEILAHPFL